MSPSTLRSFTVVLEPLQAGSGWVIARIPFEIDQVWPVRKALRVRGELSSASGKGEGFSFRSSLFAAARGGHFLVVNKKMQVAAQAGVGSKVRIRMEPDLEERAAVVPPELAKALKGDRRLRRWFDGLTPYLRRSIGATVSEARSAEGREKRAEKMAEWLLLTLEGETDTPPILKAAFQRQPLAGAGWAAMSKAQRRNHLLGIYHLQTAEGRERRAAKAVEDALRVAKKGNSGGA